MFFPPYTFPPQPGGGAIVSYELREFAKAHKTHSVKVEPIATRVFLTCRKCSACLSAGKDEWAGFEDKPWT